MNAKQIILSIIALDFAGLTAYALYAMGLSGMLEAVTTNIMTLTLTVDLVLALGMATWWMAREGRALGINATPYIIVTCLTGSLGPLLFLIKREGLANKAPARQASVAMG